MMLPLRAASCLAALCLAACTAKTAPDASIVATTGSRQFTATALAGLMGRSQLPIRDEDARAIANLWVDYHLLATAAATGDSLNDSSLVDGAIWAQVANARARKWHDIISRTWALDSLDPQELYREGTILMARQILFPVPTSAPPQQSQFIRMTIDSIRRTLTPANFAANAKKLSADRTSAEQGGEMPPWPAARGIMIPDFESGVAATPFATISGPIPTSAGIHIVYRPSYAEASRPIAAVARYLAVQRAESLYFAGLEKAANVTLVPDAVVLARTVSQDLDAWRDSAVAIAKTSRGDFTAARLVRWVSAYPAEQGMPGQLRNAPDSVVRVLLRDMVRSNLFLQQADSAGVTLTTAEMNAFRNELRVMVASTTGTLGFTRGRVPDSIRTKGPEAREQYFVTALEAFIDNMVTNRGLIVQIPRPVRQLLRARYPKASVSSAGIDAALEMAPKIRLTSDSARAATKPAPPQQAKPAGPVKP